MRQLRATRVILRGQQVQEVPAEISRAVCVTAKAFGPSLFTRPAGLVGPRVVGASHSKTSRDDAARGRFAERFRTNHPNGSKHRAPPYPTPGPVAEGRPSSARLVRRSHRSVPPSGRRPRRQQKGAMTHFQSIDKASYPCFSHRISLFYPAVGHTGKSDVVNRHPSSLTGTVSSRRCTEGSLR
jgi:hypothetical protein